MTADTVKHTPGPWRVGPIDDTRVEDAHGNEVAQIDGDYNQPETWPLMEANARLIAAAPELLLALNELLDAYSKPDERLCCDGRDCGCMGSTVHQQAEHYARAAIAKAEGRS